jgi:hypothetical protein
MLIPPPVQVDKTILANQVENKTVLAQSMPVEDNVVILEPHQSRNNLFEYNGEPELRDAKYCHECGEKIRGRAEICPKCGVRQHHAVNETSSDWRSGIKVPVLISAISNILVGLFWVSTCFGFVFAVPLFILCIFEFSLWADADKLSARRLSERGKTMGIFEIVVGLANTVSLICGIILLINSGKIVDHYDD